MPYKFNGLVYGRGVTVYYNADDSTASVKEDGTFNREDYPFMDTLGEDWECGHLLGKQLGGTPDDWNFIPMTKASNMSFLSEMENKVAKVIDLLSIMKAEFRKKSMPVDPWLKYMITVQSECSIKINGLTIPELISTSMSITDGLDGRQVPSYILNSVESIRNLGFTIPFGIPIAIDEKSKDSE